MRRRDCQPASLAAYLTELHDSGSASSIAAITVAAACFRAKLAGQPTPPASGQSVWSPGYRRAAGDP